MRRVTLSRDHMQVRSSTTAGFPTLCRTLSMDGTQALRYPSLAQRGDPTFEFSSRVVPPLQLPPTHEAPTATFIPWQDKAGNAPALRRTNRTLPLVSLNQPHIPNPPRYATPAYSEAEDLPNQPEHGVTHSIPHQAAPGICPSVPPTGANGLPWKPSSFLTGMGGRGGTLSANEEVLPTLDECIAA